MKEESKQWRKWLAAFGGAAFSISLLIGAFQVVVDPFGVWGSPVVRGFNGFKEGQRGSERVFKPYQYLAAEPSVVLMGSSRTNYCTPAKWPGVPDEKVYNLGLNGAHIPEERYYLDAALAAHRPEIVAFGLDLLQFNSVYNDPHEGFSYERLAMIAFSPPTALLYEIKETVFSADAISRSFDTVEKSASRPDLRYHVRGWNTRGMVTRKKRMRAYREILWRYHTKAYRRFQPSARNRKLFGKMVEAVRAAGATPVCYFQPLSADFLLSMEINGKTRHLEDLKRMSVEICPTWDFAYVNDVTSDRGRYNDPSHFKEDVGERVLEIVGTGANRVGDDFGVAIDERRVSRMLKRHRKRLEEWRKRNAAVEGILRRASKGMGAEEFEKRARKIPALTSPRR